jgi:hypothetical protein
MRRTIAAAVAALSFALGVPALGQGLASPHPLSEKYSDRGARPATGRSGSATLAARALLSRSGETRLEVTTGGFDAGPAPGDIAKMQVKLLAPGGRSMRTDNFAKELPGGGFASVVYSALPRGLPLQVQANVTGIDPRRTDVVTVSTQVVRRPDVEAVALQAPAGALVGAPVSVTGVLAESNGDMGAHAACRLLADGIEVARLERIWIDAGSSVNCHFALSFATPGVHELRLRIDSVAPADDDPGNNEFAARVEVREPVPSFDAFTISFVDQQFRDEEEYDLVFTGRDGSVATKHGSYLGQGQQQDARAVASLALPLPIGEGVLAWRFTMDEAVFFDGAIALASLPGPFISTSSECRSGILTTGVFTQVCAFAGGIEMLAERLGGAATYDETVDGTGAWYGHFETHTSATRLERVPVGALFGARLTLVQGGETHASQLTAPVAPFAFGNDWSAPMCASINGIDGVLRQCTRSRYSASGASAFSSGTH